MKTPSTRQIRVFQLINQGYSKRRAMIEAGYSISTANQAKRVMQTNGMRSLNETLFDKLVNDGLTIEKIAEKIGEWMDAKKPDGQPDYPTQIKALEIYLNIVEAKKPNEQKRTKRISVEEWVNESN